MLVITNLTKAFGTEKTGIKTVLNNISLTIDHGQIALFLGQSGVGKSTLLRVLSGLESYDTGLIMLDGQPLDPRNVGMVFQHFNLFEHLTVLENVTLALEKVLKQTPEQARTHATRLLTTYGLGDKLNKPVSALSGGQKQRLALARTLALNPQVICLDEPTSALDPVLTVYVANIMQDLARKGYIVFASSHDTMLIEKLDCTIYLMENGSLVTKVEARDYRANPEHYPALARFVSGHDEHGHNQ